MPKWLLEIWNSADSNDCRFCGGKGTVGEGDAGKPVCVMCGRVQ